jgi:ADP-heptose:LPS heptosyltransferase
MGMTFLLKIENYLASLVYLSANGLLRLMQLVLSAWGRPRGEKNILFFRTGSLGDILCALPVFRAVKRTFPGSRLMLLTKKEEVFSREPLTSVLGADLFEEIIYYESADLSGFRKASLLLSALRGRKIDTLFYLGQYDAPLIRLIRDMIFFYACGCRRLLGFRLNKHRLFRMPQRYFGRFNKETARLLKIIAPLGARVQKSDFILPIAPDDKKFVDSLWQRTGVDSERVKIAVVTTAKFPVNRWPKENFLYLARALISKLDAFIILIGGTDASGVSRYLEGGLGKDCLDMCGRATFMQSAEIISRCALLVSVDSGPLHMAAALGVPVAGIFTARDYPNCWFPYGEGHKIMRHDTDCQVCLKTECGSMECIKSINPEEILGACKEIIAKRAAAGKTEFKKESS